MPETPDEWVMKAESDLRTAIREFRVTGEERNLDIVCFLSQQCVEKYLKAFLYQQEIRFDKTHDLVALLGQTLPLQPLWESWRSAFQRLTSYATAFRYPGEWAEPEEAKDAIQIAKSFRDEIRQVLNV
jgi:HEPN domain-containing protein